MDKTAYLEIRMNDYMPVMGNEKALENTSKGVGASVSAYVILSIIGGIVFNKSMTMLW